MKFFQQLFRKDILIAFSVLLVSGSASGFIFDSILEEKAAETISVKDLQIGKRHFAIKSHGNCVGFFSVNLTSSREVSEIELKGKLKISTGKFLTTPEFDGLLVFNNLGQLGSSILTVQNGDLKLSLGTTGIRKMKAVVRSVMGTETHRAVIPLNAGPFLLIQEAEERYRIEGPLPNSWESMGKKNFILSVFSNLNLEVSSIASIEDNCTSESLVPVDLNPFLQRFSSLLRL